MSEAVAIAPWPTELVLDRAARTLKVTFEDGAAYTLPAELLRVESPSAERRGHGGQAPPPPGGKSGVAISAIDPVGNYAVRLRFDDGHDTGLYAWPLLYRLGRDQDRLWQAYLDALAAAGRTR